MQAVRIDGRVIAEALRGKLAEGVRQLQRDHGLTPGLAVIIVGQDAASRVYVANKVKQTAEVGMLSRHIALPETVSEAELLAEVEKLNRDPAIHGILVQLPLPKHLDDKAVIGAIDPAKDVDGFHVINAGRLATGQASLVPCTPLGCLYLLKQQHGSLAGKRAVVVGRSNIVGKPMAMLLLQADCTVTIAHSRSHDLPGLCREADILVAAVGRPEMIDGSWIKPGATVIDVGINRVEKGGTSVLVGDVVFESASAVAGAITPVPGGVGPMTIAMLLANTLTAACGAQGIPHPLPELAV